MFLIYLIYFCFYFPLLWSELEYTKKKLRIKNSWRTIEKQFKFIYFAQDYGENWRWHVVLLLQRGHILVGGSSVGGRSIWYHADWAFRWNKWKMINEIKEWFFLRKKRIHDCRLNNLANINFDYIRIIRYTSSLNKKLKAQITNDTNPPPHSCQFNLRGNIVSDKLHYIPTPSI